MTLKIRLRQQGRTNRRFYRIVVTDARFPRDGKYVESIGWYNPFEKEENKLVNVDAERAEFWLSKGAELTEKAESLIAHAAPSIIKAHKEKFLARRAKEAAKRKKRAKK